eukprot:COSAG02_NODE_1701_length_11248_cov_8.135348_1_plen_35_part_10
MMPRTVDATSRGDTAPGPTAAAAAEVSPTPSTLRR